MNFIQLAFNSSFSAHLLWIDIQIRTVSVGLVFAEGFLSWSLSYCEVSCTCNTSVELWELCHLSQTNSYQLSHKSYTTHVLLCCVLWSSVLSRDVVVFGLLRSRCFAAYLYALCFMCCLVAVLRCVMLWCLYHVVCMLCVCCVYVADAPVMSAMLPLRLLW